MENINIEEAVNYFKNEINMLKSSIEGFKKDVEDELYLKKITRELNYDIAVREKVLAELEKKDKIIELMIKHLCDVIDNDDNASLLPFYDSDDNLEEKVKQYFERKAEDE